APGDYEVRGILIGANSCSNTITYNIKVFPKPAAGFTYTPEKPIENDQDVLFYNTSTGSDITKFNWFFIDDKGYQSKQENTAYFFKNAGTYPVALIIEDIRGCKDSIIKKIVIEEDFIFYAPNAFTPNGDGLNDVFIPITRGVKFYDMMIF